MADKLLRELPNTSWYRGGLMAYPSLGYEWTTWRGNRWGIDLGYKWNRFSREEIRTDYRDLTRIQYRRWTLRTSFSF